MEEEEKEKLPRQRGLQLQNDHDTFSRQELILEAVCRSCYVTGDLLTNNPKRLLVG